MRHGTALFRVLAALALPAGLGGCGFHPLYGAADEAGVDRLRDIFVAPIGDRWGQEIRLALQTRLAGTSDAQPQGYVLAVQPSLSQEAVSIHGDNTSGRNRVVARAHWVLSSVSPAPAVLASGDVRTVDGYNVINEEYFAAGIASETTQQRIAVNLADSITQQLSTWFTNQKAPASRPQRIGPAPTLAPRDVPHNSDQSPLTATGEDGLPASSIGRGTPEQ